LFTAKTGSMWERRGSIENATNPAFQILQRKSIVEFEFPETLGAPASSMQRRAYTLRAHEVSMRSTVLGVCLILVSWAPLPHAAPQSREEAGRIEGLVFRQGGGEPVRDTIITLTALSPDPSGAPTPAPRNAISGRDGRFIVDGLRSGDYNVRAQLEGFFSADDPSVSTPSVRATITAGQTHAVRFPVIPGGAISGRVLTSNGRPSTGAQVQLYRLSYQTDGAPLLVQSRSAQADDRGEFRAYHLSPGTYYLAAAPNAGSFAARGVGAAGGVRPEVPVRTFFPGVLDIAEARPLTLASGEEIEGVNIDIRSAVLATITGKVFSSLPAKAYEPLPAAAQPGRGPNPEVPEANPAAVEAALRALEELRRQGQAGGAAAPAAQMPTAEVILVPRDRRALSDPILRAANASMAVANDGRFTLGNVPPGSYVVYASLPDNTALPPATAGQAPQPAAMFRAYGRANVDVGQTDVSDIAISVHHGVEVTGRVIADVDLSELRTIRITLRPDDSAARVAALQSLTAYPVEVGGDGVFTFPVLPESVYRVEARFSGSMGPQAFVVGVRQEDVDVTESGFKVGDGPVAPIEVFVSVKSGSVSGTALDAAGRPVPKAVVALISSERRNNPAFNRTISADDAGKFRLTGVPPGEFKLFAWQTIPLAAPRNAAFIALYEQSGMPITVEAGGEVRADARLSTASDSR
jgi:hypothetical protein